MSDEPQRLQFFLEQLLHLRDTFTDATIIVTDENGLEIANYQVHKIILATWSEVLGNLFKYERGDPPEEDTSVTLGFF